MYEHYYGFAEKPFSLTPDPKYLYRSQSHANAFDLLQYAIQRREGFVVVTGDIGTGKTTLCRALLEQIDRKTFTALVLNPFLTEEDLLKRILQDFGVISRDEARSGRPNGPSKQELIDTLYDFLLGLISINASAVLIIDEAQNLPLPVLEQIRILSNLETDKEKLLQIILVGQLNLQPLLRSPEMRQLDQRVSIRYELKPLDAESVGAYVAHRLTIAGGSASVTFTRKALGQVHRLSGGIPRLINLICDRALLSGYSLRQSRITPEIVVHAAESLDLQRGRGPRFRWLKRRASLLAGAAVVLLASVCSVGAAAYLYERFAPGTVQASTARGATPAAFGAPSAAAALGTPFGRRCIPPGCVAPPSNIPDILGRRALAGRTAALGATPDLRRGLSSQPLVNRRLPPDASVTILVGTFPITSDVSGGQIRSLTDWLEASGVAVYYADLDLGEGGRWQRVLAGAYTNPEMARRDVNRLRAAAPGLDLRIVNAAGVAPGT